MEINYNSNNNKNLSFIISALLYSFCFLFVDLGISLKYVIILFSVAMTILVFLNFNTIKNQPLKREQLLVFLVIIILLLRISSFEYVKTKPLYVFSAIIMIFNMLMFSNNEKSCRAISLIMLFPGVYSSFVVILSKLAPSIYYKTTYLLLSSNNKVQIDLLFKDGYSAAVAGNIGLTANYIVISIFLLLNIFLTNQLHKKKIFFVLILVLNILAIFLMNRRGELVSLLLSFLVVYLITLRGKKLISLISLLIIITFSAIILVTLILEEKITYSGDNRLIKSIFELLRGNNADQPTDVSNGRVGLYRIAFQLFSENFFFGIGWGGFAQYGTKYLTQVTNVHNIYIQLLCELGVFIGLLFIILLFVFLFTFKRDNKYNICAFQLFLYILLLGFVENSIYQDSFWLLFAIIYLFRNTRVSEMKQ